MKVFAVSDLHLPGNQDKPMDIFGGNWSGHLEKIKADWRERVGEEDVVLIAGDISWAMTLENALPDLRALAGLPGKKSSSANKRAVPGNRRFIRAALGRAFRAFGPPCVSPMRRLPSRALPRGGLASPAAAAPGSPQRFQ